MGAAGVLLVSGPVADSQDTFETLGTEGFSVGIPVFRIKRELADKILAKSGNTIESLEKKINQNQKACCLRNESKRKGNS